jgi:hypothetical protein
MGDKIVQYFEEAKRLGGLMGQVRLAMLTTVISSKAPTIPDTPDNLQKFREAIEQVKIELLKKQ